MLDCAVLGWLAAAADEEARGVPGDAMAVLRDKGFVQPERFLRLYHPLPPLAQ